MELKQRKIFDPVTKQFKTISTIPSKATIDKTAQDVPTQEKADGSTAVKQD